MPPSFAAQSFSIYKSASFGFSASKFAMLTQYFRVIAVIVAYYFILVEPGENESPAIFRFRYCSVRFKIFNIFAFERARRVFLIAPMKFEKGTFFLCQPVNSILFHSPSKIISTLFIGRCVFCTLNSIISAESFPYGWPATAQTAICSIRCTGSTAVRPTGWRCSAPGAKT